MLVHAQLWLPFSSLAFLVVGTGTPHRTDNWADCILRCQYIPVALTALEDYRVQQKT